MRPGQSIQGEQVEKLITKYFYKENHLCYQIYLYTKTNETVVFEAFTDFSEYKKAFNNLQEARSKNLKVDIPNKNYNLATKSAKVA